MLAAAGAAGFLALAAKLGLKQFGERLGVREAEQNALARKKHLQWLADMPAERKAEMLLNGHDVPGARILDGTYQQLKLHYKSVVDSKRIVLLGEGGGRMTSLEEMMRSDMANTKTEFFGYASLAEIDGQLHLLVLDRTASSERLAGAELDAIERLRAGKAEGKHFEKLRQLVTHPYQQELRGKDVSSFSLQLLEDLKEGKRLAKDITGHEAADWISTTYLDTTSRPDPDPLPPALQGKALEIHFHPSPAGPSKGDLDASHSDEPRMVVSNNGRYAETHFYHKEKIIHSARTRFEEPMNFNSLYGNAIIDYRGEDRELATHFVYYPRSFSSLADYATKPKHLFFFHQGEWRKAKLQRYPEKYEAKLPRPMRTLEALEQKHVLVDDAGRMYDDLLDTTEKK